MNLNPFAISNLLIALICLPFFITLFLYGKTSLCRTYSLHALSVGSWGLFAFLATSTNSFQAAQFFWKIACCSVLFIPVFFLHAVLIMTSRKNQILLFIAYLYCIFFIFLICTNRLLNHLIIFSFNSFYYVNDTSIPYVILLVVWFFLVFIAHTILMLFYLKKKDKHSLIISISNGIGFVGGAMNFLPAIGFNIYPFGNFLIPVYFIILTFATFKYQLFELNIVVRKGISYSISITIFSLIYLSSIILLEKFFQVVIGYSSIVISMFFTFAIVIFFIPLRDKIQSFVDRLFLGKTPQQIFYENELLKQELMRSEKLKAVAQFASGMAHEIKNPLTAIKTFTEYISDKQKDPEFIKNFSRIVGTEVDRIDHLVRELLDFSKPAPLQFRDVNIHTVIDETLDLLNSQFIKYNINVIKNYTLPATCSTLKLDSNQMKQVFLNLFLNAIEAMPNGGIFTLETKEAKTGEFMEIHIKDVGCGIPEKDLPHIFEPFYTTKEKGSGLGLSIIYNIIKEHRGQIKVSSILGRGTEFIISIPKN